MMCDPEFRAALAAAGFTLDPATGEIAELAPYVGAFSERAAQIGRNIDRYEAEWRTTNPGQEPGPAVRRSWDRRAWKDARPDKIVPDRRRRTRGARGTSSWPTSATSDPSAAARAADRRRRTDVWVRSTATPPWRPSWSDSAPVGRRWNAADIRGEAEKMIAAAGLVADASRSHRAGRGPHRPAVQACVPLLRHPDVPEHIRSLTSRHVLSTRGRHRGPARATAPSVAGGPDSAVTSAAGMGSTSTSATQLRRSPGDAELVVVEGAAGAGKTTTLAATQSAARRAGPSDAGGDPDPEGRPGRGP